MNVRLPLAVVLAAVLAVPAGAFAQQKYPAKSIRLVLPFAAGSAVDTLARIYAQQMTESWKQQVVVDNRTGANGIIGTEIAARSAPDGYTMYMGNIATLAFNDVLAGQVPMMISGVVTALPHHRTGRLRLIGTTGIKRTSATPDIPTIAETGLPGYEGDSWTGFLAPAGTPADIIARVHAEAVRIGQLPETRERLTGMGFEVVGSSPEAFAALIKNDTARLGKVIRDAGIRAE